MKDLLLILSLLALPAHATLIGVLNHDNGRTDLFDDAGPCAGKALRAEFVPVEGKVITGCWVLEGSGESIRVILLDARMSQFLLSDIKPAKAV